VIPSPVAGKSLLTVHEPLGVAALIAPWNFPIGMPARKVRFLTSLVGEKSLLTVHKPLLVAAIITPLELPYWHASQKGEVFNTPPVGEKSLLTMHEPLGVAALNALWNFPIGTPVRKVRFLTSPVGERSLLTACTSP